MNIPNDWLLVKLSDVITEMQPGFAQRPSGKNKNTGIPQLRTNNVSSEGTIDLSNLVYVTASGIELEKYGLRQGDVIFNNTNSLEWVGKTAYFNETGEFVLSNHMTRIRVNERLLNGEFLAKYLHYLWHIGWAGRWAKQWVNQAAIDQMALGKFHIVLPSLSEQQQIIEFLNEVDEVRNSRRQSVAKSQMLLLSLFREMFGDPIINEKQWPTKSLKRMGLITTGNTPPRDSPDNFGDYIEWVKSDNLDSPLDFVAPTKEKLSLKGAKIGRVVPKGSTLITCIAGSPESIGKAALADRDLAFNQQITGVTPFEEVNPYFLYSLIKLSKPAIQTLSSGGMTGIVNKSQLEELSVISPPKELQNKFASRVSQVFDYKAELVKSEERIDDLIRSLMARAFSGELTQQWREENNAKLLREEAERNRLLGQLKRARGPLEDSVEEIKPTSERHHLVRKLGLKQLYVLEVVKTMKSEHLGFPIKEYFVARDIEHAQQRISVDMLTKAIDEISVGEQTNAVRRELPYLSRSDARQSLQLLAEMGLIRRVRLATNPSGRDVIIFAPAYRQLAKNEDVRLKELAILEVDRT